MVLMTWMLGVKALVAQIADIAVLQLRSEVEALQNDMEDSADKVALVAGIHMVDGLDGDIDCVEAVA